MNEFGSVIKTSSDVLKLIPFIFLDIFITELIFSRALPFVFRYNAVHDLINVRCVR